MTREEMLSMGIIAEVSWGNAKVVNRSPRKISHCQICDTVASSNIFFQEGELVLCELCDKGLPHNFQIDLRGKWYLGAEYSCISCKRELKYFFVSSYKSVARVARDPGADTPSKSRFLYGVGQPKVLGYESVSINFSIPREYSCPYCEPPWWFKVEEYLSRIDEADDNARYEREKLRLEEWAENLDRRFFPERIEQQISIGAPKRIFDWFKNKLS